jgi:hypothetical protein
VSRALLTAVVVAGCQHGCEPIAMFSESSPVQLAPRVAAPWPAVPRGFVRIESLGVDVAVPRDDADVYEEIDWARISWDGERGECRLQVAPDTRGRPDRIAGTLPLACSVIGDGCGSCGEIRPIRGGPAEEPYPVEPPVVAITSAWSDRQQDRSGLFAWRDGTVQFYGAACAGYRGRRGSLPAVRVAALVDALERGGLLDHQIATNGRAKSDPLCEHSVTAFTLRSGARTNAMQWTCAADALVSEAMSRVRAVVGPDPCEWRQETRDADDSSSRQP